MIPVTWEEFGNILISRRGGQPIYKPIFLKEIAHVEDSLADQRRISRVLGKPAVGLGIRKQIGANAVDVAHRVKQRMKEVQKDLPEGMEIGVNFDSTTFVEEAIHELLFTLFLSALLTALVCWIFLGSWSSTLNILLAIPTSIIGTFLVFRFMNFTFNTFTVLALSLAIGIVVDDAIMVLENIVRYHEKGKSRMEAAQIGARQITFAAVAATLALVAIFLPVAFMKGGCHMSYTTIQQFFREVIGLEVSRGLLCKATQKVSLSLQPAYQQLAERLGQESQIGVDETGHHDEGKLHWTWCFDTSDYSLFRIAKSRGSQVLEEMLGSDFDGLICADYWGAYRKYARLFDVRVQYCLAHLIREILFLAEHDIKKLSRWGNLLLEWLKKLFRTLHRRQKLTARGFLRSLERIKEGFLSRMRRPPDHVLARRLARRFRGKAAEAYFRFLTEPGLEPTNNGTERQIRPVVIDRRITQGTRGEAGMRWCERIWTILASCKKQNRNVFDFIHQSLLAHWTNNPYPELL